MKAVWFAGLILLAVATAHAGEVSFEEVCAAAIKNQGTALKTPEQKEVLRGLVQFGLDVHHDLVKTKGQETVVSSPFSIMSMLSLLRLGASGDTGEEMQRAMGGLDKLTPTQFHEGMGGISDALFTMSKDVTLTFGNLAVADERYTLKPRLQTNVDKYYKAEVWNRDFSKGVVDEINGFISQQTNKMIPKLLNPDDEPAGWAMVNAGYYKAAWAIEFDQKYTSEDGEFTKADGSTTKVPLMQHLGAHVSYYEEPGFQMASLPYKDSAFAMDIILPTIQTGENGGSALERVSATFNQKNYFKWLAGRKIRELDALALPRWEAKSTFRSELRSALQARMPLVFSDGAELTEMFEGRTAPKLGPVVGSYLLKTNEKGSEGAFVTFGGGLESLSRNPSLVADHPFIVVIRHIPTGIPVFVVTEWNPKPLPPPDAKAAAAPAADKEQASNEELDVLITRPAAEPGDGGPEVIVLAPSLAGRTEAQRLDDATDALARMCRNIQVLDMFLQVSGLPQRETLVSDPTAGKTAQIREILAAVKAKRLGDKFVKALDVGTGQDTMALLRSYFYGRP